MKAAWPLMILCLALTSAFGQQSRRALQETYVRAAVDADGQLRISCKEGRKITIGKEPEQVEFDQIAISPDGHAVGWLEMYPNCCTSYPIPLKLGIYTRGKRRAFRGRELPVWRWTFSAGGRQVAFEQETVHGGWGVHYELRNAINGRLLGEYDPQPDSENASLPAWVRELDEKR